jgi:hypothetical protein
MNTTWHAENGRLACRWSELPQHVPYNPSWMQKGTTTGAESATPCFLDFHRFSGLGGRKGITEC